MHSLVSRLNAVTALATSVLLSVLAAVALTSFVIPNTLDAKVQQADVHHLNVVLGRLGRGTTHNKEREYAFVNFDLQADLRPLFNWNTKQVFVYFTAEYSTDTHPFNQAVIWDRIIKSEREAKINISNLKNKYMFKEISDAFNEANVTFSLQYNIMPYVGLLRYGEALRTESMKLPPKQSQLAK